MESKRQRLERAGQWLREARARAGHGTAAEFARALGIDASIVSRYETGSSEVSDERAEQIAHALGMDIIQVRRGLGMWVGDEEWVDKLADSVLGYELDGLRLSVLSLLEQLDEILRHHVGEPDQADERAAYRRALALGDDPDPSRTIIDTAAELHGQLDEIELTEQPSGEEERPSAM